MDDIAQQIRAWTDAAAERAGDAVSAEEIVSGRHRATHARRPSRATTSTGRRLVLAAAVVLVLLGAAAALVAALGRRNTTAVDANRPAATGTTERSEPADTTGEVAFRVLSVTPAAEDLVGTLRAATTQRELAAIWPDAASHSSPPTIDFAREVIVSITISEDGCPPTLAFERSGTTLEPHFLQKMNRCATPLMARTYLAALGWSTTGPAFRLDFRPRPLDDHFTETFMDIKRFGQGAERYDEHALQADLQRRFADTVGLVYFDKTTLVVPVSADAVQSAIRTEIEAYNEDQPSSPAIRLEVFRTTSNRLRALMAKELRLDRVIRARGAVVNGVGIDSLSRTLSVGLEEDTAKARAIVLDELGANPLEISFSQQDVVPANGGN